MYAIGFNKLQQFISVNQSKNINQDLTKCYLSYIILVHFKCLLINKKNNLTVAFIRNIWWSI